MWHITKIEVQYRPKRETNSIKDGKKEKLFSVSWHWINSRNSTTYKTYHVKLKAIFLYFHICRCSFVVKLHVHLFVLDDEFGEFDELLDFVAEDLLEVDVAEASTQIRRPTARSEHVILRLMKDVDGQVQ